MEDDGALRLYHPGAFDELVRVLEAARSRLAIAAAADSKMTTLAQRVSYLETDARLRRCLRRLRARRWPGPSACTNWMGCLEGLTRLLSEGVCRGRSQRMCERLDEILGHLEGGREGTAAASGR